MALDEVMIIREEKKWDEACELNGEIQDWLVFLLSLVDFMKPSAGECLKEFFSGKSQCCIVNQEFIRVQVYMQISFICLYVYHKHVNV